MSMLPPLKSWLEKTGARNNFSNGFKISMEIQEKNEISLKCILIITFEFLQRFKIFIFENHEKIVDAIRFSAHTLYLIGMRGS